MFRSETWKVYKTIHYRLFLFLANFYCDCKKCLYISDGHGFVKQQYKVS